MMSAVDWSDRAARLAALMGESSLLLTHPIELREELDEWIDERAELGRCSACPAKVWWVVTRNGKRMPVSGDGDSLGLSHFVDCPLARRFRKRRGRR